MNDEEIILALKRLKRLAICGNPYCGHHAEVDLCIQEHPSDVTVDWEELMESFPGFAKKMLAIWQY